MSLLTELREVVGVSIYKDAAPPELRVIQLSLLFLVSVNQTGT